MAVGLHSPPGVPGNLEMSPCGGAAASASSDTEAESGCCKIPGFFGADKTAGEGDGVIRKWCRKWWLRLSDHRVGCTLVAVLVLVGGIMSMSSMLGGRLDRSTATQPHGPELPKPWETVETNVTLSGKLMIVARRDWLARPRPDAPDCLHPPVPYVIVSHSASEGCDTQAACTQMVRYIQTFHVEGRGWSDIAYNFLVGGDGYVYEGRGWTVVGAHTYGYNNRSLGLNVIGTFITDLPSAAQLVALRQLIEMGVQEGYIAENYKLMAHRQLSRTESPGARFFEELKTWPHWSERP